MELEEYQNTIDAIKALTLLFTVVSNNNSLLETEVKSKLTELIGKL